MMLACLSTEEDFQLVITLLKNPEIVIAHLPSLLLIFN